ncbi:DUF1905 domain-containing protein [Candidatus Peregrinibacteria bacterium]|nr:MAG: DUF1905 domain-containing protein [Candidatus Peregrinibacteria bacterium]
MNAFKSTPFTIGDWLIIALPKDVSAPLPSRGMVMGKVTVNQVEWTVPLEPDGKGSHWFAVEKALQKKANVTAGESVSVTVESLNEWPEPEVPADIKTLLETDPLVLELWLSVTPKARWDWIRWVRSTGSADTRAIRIEKMASKLKSGKRNPCCFNRSMCTVPEVSKTGVLMS